MQGSGEYTVPYSGYYDILLAGAQGSGYNSLNGGKGAVLKATIWLKKDQVIKYEAPLQSEAGHNVNGIQNIPGGKASRFYVDDQLVMLAGGGAGQYSDERADGNVYDRNNNGTIFDDNSVPMVPEKTPELVMQDGEGTSGQTWHDMKMHWHTYPQFYKYKYNVSYDANQDEFHMFIDQCHYPSGLSGYNVGAQYWHYDGAKSPNTPISHSYPYQHYDYNRTSDNYIMATDLFDFGDTTTRFCDFNTSCYSFKQGKIMHMCDDLYYPQEWHTPLCLAGHDGVIGPYYVYPTDPIKYIAAAPGGHFDFCIGVNEIWFDWHRTCGHNNGDIVSGEFSKNGSSYWDKTDENQLEITEQSYSNTGMGKFQIGIHERSLNYTDRLVGNTYYYDDPVWLIIYDDTITYFKRR